MTNIKELLASSTDRLLMYKQNKDLYEGEAYKIFNQNQYSYHHNTNPNKPELTYINYNVFAIISEAFADLIWNESPKITFKSEANQTWFDGWRDRSRLFTRLYESTLNASIQSESVLKLDIRETIPKTKDFDVVVDEINPEVWYPIFDKTNISKLAEFQCLIFVKEADKAKIYLVEKYGYNELIYEAYKEVNGEYSQIDPRDHFSDALNGQAPREIPDGDSVQLVIETNTKLPLVTHLQNISCPQNYHGDSDYSRDLLSLGSELNTSLTTLSSIIKKHADPMLVVPSTAITQAIAEVKGTNEKQGSNQNTFSNSNTNFSDGSLMDRGIKAQVANAILNNSKVMGLPSDGSQVKPEYITWDADLDAIFRQIEGLTKMIFHKSGISPIFYKEDLNLGAMSGTAIKRLSMAMINKAKRKQIYLSEAIKSLIYTAQELAISNPAIAAEYRLTGAAEVPTIQWSDGFPNDLQELAATHQALIDIGVENSTDAMQAIFDYDQKTADAKAREIQDNQININTPILGQDNQPAS